MKNEKLLELTDNSPDELSLEDLYELTNYLSEKAEILKEELRLRRSRFIRGKITY